MNLFRNIDDFQIKYLLATIHFIIQLLLILFFTIKSKTKKYTLFFITTMVLSGIIMIISVTEYIPSSIFIMEVAMLLAVAQIFIPKIIDASNETN